MVAKTDDQSAILEAIRGIGDKLETLEQRVNTLQSAKPDQLPIIENREQRLRNMRPQLGEGAVTRAVVSDLRYGQVAVQFPVDSTVRLRETSELYQRIKQRKPETGEIRGIVIKIGHVMKRTHQPKYIVEFPGFGKDGVSADDLEFAD